MPYSAKSNIRNRIPGTNCTEKVGHVFDFGWYAICSVGSACAPTAICLRAERAVCGTLLAYVPPDLAYGTSLVWLLAVGLRAWYAMPGTERWNGGVL
eukprot:1789252-Rhodomonas_salina.3